MAGKVLFELVSPEKILVSEEVDMVVVPGGEGNFGVLPGHAPLISSGRPGVIDIHNGGAVAERIFIAGGFAEVTPARCTVLADEASGLDGIDRAAAQADLESAESQLPAAREAVSRNAADLESGAALRQIERAFRIATAKLDALGTGNR